MRRIDGRAATLLLRGIGRSAERTLRLTANLQLLGLNNVSRDVDQPHCSPISELLQHPAPLDDVLVVPLNRLGLAEPTLQKLDVNL